ncbi:MAG: transcriptional repressor [Pirellulales bacterium]|jgi:Fur family ferric uptake transcriptional regulator|nr:transcriptional repressor [Pirellulales bacterium]
MSKPQPAPTPDEVRARIRRAGLRSTASRVAVLQRLEAAGRPVTHAELAEELGRQGFDRATVYRNLADLTEAGLVTRSELGDHVWRFEARREGLPHTLDHPHFVCLDCGSVACLSDVQIQIQPAPGSKRSVIGQLTEVLLKGRCGRCV